MKSYTDPYYVTHMILIHTCTSTYSLSYQVLYTHTYIYSTYSLQECVCFRIDAHTAAEQQPNTNTDKYNITYKFIQVKTVSDLYRHRLIALIVYYIPIIPPNYYHLY